LTGQMEALQTLHGQAELSRAMLEERIGNLADAVERVASGLSAGQAADRSAEHASLLTRIAEGQEKLATVLTSPDSQHSVDAENRMRLRSIDVQLLRILEEIAAGRQESITDLRSDLAALTGAVRQLSRNPVGRV
jgi:hypothetical protein